MQKSGVLISTLLLQYNINIITTEQDISEAFLSPHSLDHIVLKLWGFMLDLFEEFKM